jgi:hypothetical protein
MRRGDRVELLINEVGGCSLYISCRSSRNASEQSETRIHFVDTFLSPTRTIPSTQPSLHHNAVINSVLYTHGGQPRLIDGHNVNYLVTDLTKDLSLTLSITSSYLFLANPASSPQKPTVMALLRLSYRH